MGIYTLTVIDTTGIQDYIFGSNVLKHNVGASALVHWATNDWVCEELIRLGRDKYRTKSASSTKVQSTETT